MNDWEKYGRDLIKTLMTKIEMFDGQPEQTEAPSGYAEGEITDMLDVADRLDAGESLFERRGRELGLVLAKWLRSEAVRYKARVPDSPSRRYALDVAHLIQGIDRSSDATVEESAAEDRVRFVSGKEALLRAADLLRTDFGSKAEDYAVAAMLEFHAGDPVAYAHALRIAYAVLDEPEPGYLAGVLGDQ